MSKLQEINNAIKFAEQGRGNSKKLLKVTPIQISIYNIFMQAKRELESLQAVIEYTLEVYNVTK